MEAFQHQLAGQGGSCNPIVIKYVYFRVLSCDRSVSLERFGPGLGTDGHP